MAMEASMFLRLTINKCEFCDVKIVWMCNELDGDGAIDICFRVVRERSVNRLVCKSH